MARRVQLTPGSTRALVVGAGGAVTLALLSVWVPATPTAWERTGVRSLMAMPDALEMLTPVGMVFGTRLGVVVVCVACLAGRRARTAAVVLTTGTLAWATATALKVAVDRPRPATRWLGSTLRDVEAGAGFPSAHTSIAIGVATALILSARPSLGATIALAAAGAGVGLGRIYLGVHWPLDVVGGTAVGLSCACLVWGLTGPGPRKVGRHPDVRALASPPARPSSARGAGRGCRSPRRRRR